MGKKTKRRKRGMGSIFKKRNSWFIGFYQDGKQIKEKVGPVGLTTKGQAEQALKARMGEVAQDRFKIRKTKKSIFLNDLIDEYLENKKDSFRENIALDKFAKYAGNVRLNEITSWTFEQYKSHRKESVKPGTINRELNVLRSMFNRAIDRGHLDKNPLRGVKKAIPKEPDEYERKPQYIPEKVFENIYNNSPANLKPFILILRNTGMRVSELLRLRWGDINFDNGYLLIRQSKNSTQRDVPINEAVTNALRKLTTDSEFVFNYKSKDTVGNVWRKVLKRLGISGYRLHDLRHSVITDLVTRGVDITTVMEISGHRDIRMLKRYSHPTLEHKKNAVKVLEMGSNKPRTRPAGKMSAKTVNDDS